MPFVVPPETGWFDQSPHRIRLGWGPNGLRTLAPAASVVVVVDVLSFSTSVDVALGRGAVVLPYRWHDGSEHDYARSRDATVAVRRRLGERAEGSDPVYTLRPSSLTGIEAGTRLVLPSPNGSALTFAAREAGEAKVLVGCLRNASAVGEAAAGIAGPGSIAVIAAGERWRGTTGPLRPAVEDLLGAGAVLAAAAGFPTGPDRGDASPEAGASGLGVGTASPEARAAMAAYVEARPQIGERLAAAGSGRQLIEQGHGADVELAAAVDESTVVPTLTGDELRS